MAYQILASLEEIQAERFNAIQASIDQWGRGMMTAARNQRNPVAGVRKATTAKPANNVQRNPVQQSQYKYGQFDSTKHVRHQDGSYTPINRQGTAGTWAGVGRKAA